MWAPETLYATATKYPFSGCKSVGRHSGVLTSSPNTVAENLCHSFTPHGVQQDEIYFNLHSVYSCLVCLG